MCWVGSRRIMSYVTVLYANVPVWWFGLHYFLAQAQIDCHKIFFVAAWVVQQLAIDSESLIQNVQVPRYCTNSSWFLHYRKFAILTRSRKTLHEPLLASTTHVPWKAEKRPCRGVILRIFVMQLLLGLDGEDRYRTGGYCRFLDIIPNIW